MVQTPKQIKSDGSDGHEDYRVEMNSSSKKCNKPLMERRRRARINDSLNQLKALVLQANGKDESNFNKLDKADILEMTVKHIATIQQHGLTGSPPSISDSSNFAGGFSACAKETLGLLSTLSDVTGSSTALQAGLFNHLARTPCSPNAGTISPKHYPKPHSPGYTPQRSQQQQRHARVRNTPYDRPSNVPISPQVNMTGDSPLRLPARPLEINADVRMPMLQKRENESVYRYQSPSYGYPIVPNPQTSAGHRVNVNLNCIRSQSTSGHALSRVELPQTTVKQEPDNVRDYDENVRDYSDSASEGSRSPSSDGSSPPNSNAWRPW